MARYAIQQQAKSPQALQSFDLEGYGFTPDASNENTLVFRRNTSA